MKRLSRPPETPESMPPPYAVDTSIWIDIWRHYPPDIFASLWEQLRAAISDGHIVSPEEVLHELRRGTDELAELLEAEVGLFIPLEEDIQAGVTVVMARCPDLSDEEGVGSGNCGASIPEILITSPSSDLAS